MTCNMGGIERPIRIVLGLWLLGLVLFGGMPTIGMWVFGVIGAITLVTGIVGYCLAWTLFGVNTCHIKQTEKV